MEIIKKRILDIVPYAKNAKKHDNRQINNVAESIKQYGFVQPIVIDKNNVVVIGHCRLLAAKQLKMKEVPCVCVDDLTEEQVKALRIVDNKSNESEWDFDILPDELAELDLSDFDFDFGIEDEAEETEIVEDEAPEVDEDSEPITKLGDIWQLGRHRLMCGDSTDKATVEMLMDGKKADMVFTDPPYGMNLDTDYSSMKSEIFKGGIGGKKYDAGKVDEFHPEMINAVLSISAKEVFMWGADYFAELLPNKNDGSWIVWDKRANGNNDDAEDCSSDKMYGSCFELCWSKKKHKRDIARVKWAGIFGMSSQDQNKRFHPTQKPLELCGWFLKRYSKENENIIDLFGGSGSTLIACEQLDRNCFMMELDEKYCDVIIKRWEKFTGEKAVLING